MNLNPEASYKTSFQHVYSCVIVKDLPPSFLP